MKLKVLLVATCALLTACGSSNKDKKTEPEYDFAPLRTSIQKGMELNKATAASVAISRNGKVIFAETFGENYQGLPALNKDTHFQMGSTMKFFTALAMLKLEQQGVLSMNEELLLHMPDIEYLPEYADHWSGITLHHLLSQQSGLMDWNDYRTEVVGEDISQFALQQYPQFPNMTKPGQFFSYSNPNYTYSGALIEQLTKANFRTWMGENVFSPLGMTSTTMVRDVVRSRNNYTLGISVEGEKLKAISEVLEEPVALATGSETWTTASDVLKMADFLFKGNDAILTNEFRNKITTRHVDTDDATYKVSSYGYGLGIRDGLFAPENKYYPIKVWDHDGATDHYGSQFYMFPDHQVAISILVNNPSSEFSETIFELLKTLKILPEAKPYPFTPEVASEFEHYVGTYRGYLQGQQATMDVTLEDNKLRVYAPEFEFLGIGYEPEIEPFAGTGFYFANDRTGQLELEFRDMDNDGQMDLISNRAMVLYRDGFTPE